MNRLDREKSAYLRQHATNPVHWWAWSPEAFETAKRENKPVLISIGYSTCHWCHVMEHESFEDAEVAQLLNTSFIAIKVDREEHPDVDQFYMDALHTMVARGGWPLNIFATPDRTPFFGGTYFPKAQVIQLLSNIAHVWAQDPRQIEAQGKQVLDHMKQGIAGDAALAGSFGSQDFSRRWHAWMEKVGELQLRNFDPIWGGFGGAPKFPRSHATSALLRAAELATDPGRKLSLNHAVEQTLKGMAYGGMWDHLGGGFHRYSTDQEWHVPHFEKMLYDQALLVQTYAEDFLATRSPLARGVVEGILDYLETEMRLESGAWAAAQDADSEGVEGKFFVWSRPEISQALGISEGGLFSEIFDVRPGGNWEGTNVLRLKHAQDVELWSNPEIKRLKQKLYDVRKRRIAPLRDEKVLVSWNAWMAAALFQASYAFSADDVLFSTRLRGAALKTLEYLLVKSPRPEDLAHIYYADVAFEEALLEDHAALVEALQSATLYSALPLDLEMRFDREARSRIDWIEKNFRDAEGNLLPRRRESSRFGTPWSELQDEDGANPSAYSTYMGVVARELMLRPRADLEESFWKDLRIGARISDRHPVILTYMLNQLEIVARGAAVKVPPGEKREFLLKCAEKGYRPSEVLVVEHERLEFELCEWGACFMLSAKRFEIIVGLAKRLRTQHT
ncbi:MAG: thioredoxin domain-containing protein [Bdellovibrionota bacterium]